MPHPTVEVTLAEGLGELGVEVEWGREFSGQEQYDDNIVSL